ncbi:hypothetical protein Plhal304r1_c029g0094871 [Plasmopara halstedii]
MDTFIDVLGNRKVSCCSCKGFLEMNVLVRRTMIAEQYTTATQKERRKKEGKEKFEVKKMKPEEAHKDDMETSLESTAKVVKAEIESVTGGDVEGEQTVMMPIEKQIMKRNCRQGAKGRSS